MRTREVPHDQWKPVLDGFANRHKGDPIHLETIGGETGPKSILFGSPLMNIAAAIDDGRIEVIAGAASESQTHSIGHPTHLSVSETDDGNLMGLQITEEDGCVTCLRIDLEEAQNAPPGYYLG